MRPSRGEDPSRPFRVLVAGGGTGGHAVPAVAIAEALRRRRPGCEVLLLGTARGVEARIVPQAGFPLETISVIGLRRSLHPDLVRFPFVVLRGFLQSIAQVRAFHPDVVVCTGGYVSGPVALAARVLGVSLSVHEQNLLPGLTARLISRGAAMTFSAFAGALPKLGGKVRRAVGCPLRQRPARVEPARARATFGLEAGRKTLLVVGGSQGARGINEALRGALAGLLGDGLQILWQTGRLDFERMAEASKPFGARVQAVPFIDDMAAAYSAADLALTRAGAMTLAELNLFGLPAILVPLPTSAEGHQEVNARSMARAGSARMILQENLTPEVLATAVRALMVDDAVRAKMGAASRSLAVEDAAQRIADAVSDLGARRRERRA